MGLDDEDARWIVAYGLTTGAIQLAPYDLAWFLGRLVEPSHPDWDLISSFLADVDYIDDGYVDPEVACHVVEHLERIGASGVILEDQKRPRRLPATATDP